MIDDLERLIGPGTVVERTLRDLWPRGLMAARAGAAQGSAVVVRPPTVEDVSALVRWARSAKVSVTPLGGGSGVCGAISGTAGEVVLDLGALDRFTVDPNDLIVRAEAGVNGMVLEKALNEQGLTLGHFPSSLPVASIGGLLATRSSGQQSSYHGNIEDLVLALKVVLSDGSIARSRPPARTAVGPNLHELFLGSEGGLGVIVEVVLAARRLPASVRGRGVSLSSLGAGLAAMREIMQRDLRPFVMRLYDAEDSAFQDSGAEGCLLVVAVAGEPEVTVAQALVVDRLLANATDLGEKPWQRWLEHRFRLSADRLRQSLEPPGSYLDTIEVAAPWSVLEGLHEDVKRTLSIDGIALGHFSHPTAQGCCAYFTFAGHAPDEGAALAAYEAAWAGAMAACERHGATIGHHHGTGLARAPWIRSEMGEWLNVWNRVRSALDPDGNMNPRALGGRP